MAKEDRHQVDSESTKEKIKQYRQTGAGTCEMPACVGRSEKKQKESMS